MRQKLRLADVAGMLRSFDYAAWAGVFRFAESDPAAFEQLLAPALAWRDLTSAAFLAEYQLVIADPPGWPGAAGALPLLRLFELRRLFEEIAREPTRPTNWLQVSLRRIRALIEGGGVADKPPGGPVGS